MAMGDEVVPGCLGPRSGVHEDVLRGTDAETGGWEGVFRGGEFVREEGMRAEMERRLGLDG